MPSFQVAVNASNQAIVNVLIVPNNTEIPKENALEQFQQRYAFRALVDTGANQSCITQYVQDTLNLIPREATFITTASHANVQSHRHGVFVGLPVTNRVRVLDEKDQPQYTENINIQFIPTMVNTLPNLSDNYSVLLGMDILNNCCMFLGHKELCLSF